MQSTPADSTGGSTTSKTDGADKLLPKSQWKYFPSIEEQALGESKKKERL